MEQPRTDGSQPVPADPNQPMSAHPGEDEETTEQHWSPFAPAGTGEFPAPHSGLNPPTQQQPTVPPPAASQQSPGPPPPQAPQHPYGQVYRPADPVPQRPTPPGGVPLPTPPGGIQQPVPPGPNSAPPFPTAPHSAAPASGSPYQQPYPQQPPGPAGQVAPGNLPVPMTSSQDASVTADDFARRRTAAPAKPTATMGARAVLRKSTFGLVSLPPSKWEQEVIRSTEAVRRNFGGLRQITVVNPKGGAGKTVAVLMLAMMFGQRRGGYVLAWDNNETQGTLGMRAQQDFHSRTVRDLLSDLAHFQGPTGRVGDLSQYVRAQGEAMFDVLASDESATAGEMLTAQAFADIREIVSRFYKLIVVDTGNNVRAANWQSAMDATDQLVVTMSARNDSAETAARMLDHLEQSGRRDLVRHAVTVVSMPAHRKDLDLPAVQRHFAARTRAVLLAPYEKLLDSGEPIRYGMLSQATREAWLKIAASVAEGL